MKKIFTITIAMILVFIFTSTSFALQRYHSAEGLKQNYMSLITEWHGRINDRNLALTLMDELEDPKSFNWVLFVATYNTIYWRNRQDLAVETQNQELYFMSTINLEHSHQLMHFYYSLADEELKTFWLEQMHQDMLDIFGYPRNAWTQ